MLQAKLKPIRSNDERSSTRYRLLLSASAEAAEIGLVDITIRDLSSTGFLVECNERLVPGTEITLELPDGTFSVGEIVWTSGNFFGGEFRIPLSIAALASARLISPVVGPLAPVPESVDRHQEDAGAVDPEERDARLPVGRRILIIVGTSVLLWVPIAVGIWLAFG